MLDPHMLRDIGLDPATVEEEYRQPAARPLGLVVGEGHIAKRPIDLGPQLTDEDGDEWAASSPLPVTKAEVGDEPVMPCQPS